MTGVLTAVVLVLLAVGVAVVARHAGQPTVEAQRLAPSCVPAIPSPGSSTAPGSSTSAGAVSPAVGLATPGSFPLPDLILPCLDGGHPVRLTGIGGPMVVNLWASWCAPCRKELPALQSYAARAGDRVRVLGVATNDTASAARSFAADAHLTFPMLADEQGRLLAAVGRTALPVTIFVDAAGRVTHLYNAQALDEPALERLIENHLGVVVR
jgi:thiol-disulfide isomerase/thioredoxin